MKIAEGVNSLLQMSGLLARLCQKTMAPVASQSGELIAWVMRVPEGQWSQASALEENAAWTSVELAFLQRVTAFLVLPRSCGSVCVRPPAEEPGGGKGPREPPGHGSQSGHMLAFQLIKPYSNVSNNVATLGRKESQLPVSVCAPHLWQVEKVLQVVDCSSQSEFQKPEDSSTCGRTDCRETPATSLFLCSTWCFRISQ